MRSAATPGPTATRSAFASRLTSTGTIMTNLHTRRSFLSHTGLGMAALASLLGDEARAEGPRTRRIAKHVIFLFQSGGPSQIELLDPKPRLRSLHGSELPDSIRMGQRLTGMTSGQ